MWRMPKNEKRTIVAVQMLGMTEADQLAMANSVSWYGYVSMGKHGHILRKHYSLRLTIKGR